MASTDQSLHVFTSAGLLNGFGEKNKLRKRRLIMTTYIVRRDQKSQRSYNLSVDHDQDHKKTTKHKILIAGGGIGGLVFALAAKRSGFDVKVFERDLTAVRGEGRDRGPIQLLSSAMGLLESIDKDVAREIMEAGYVTGDRKSGLADGITSEWFAKFDFLTPAIQKRMPVTQIICRMELQRLLVNALGEDIVINKSKVVDFDSDAKKVTVFLENGEQYEGDVLVGADGIRSVVRSKLFGPKEPKYSNYICYTGVAEFHPKYLPVFGYKIFLGRNQYFVALDIGNGRMQWYAFVREARESLVPSTDWCDEVVTIICKTKEDMIIRRPIHDIDMISTWGKGRVILLGDAAHAMLPNLGQGGSMAIEDCYWLMLELHSLAQNHPRVEIPLDELTMAFRRFEKKRMFRVRTLHSICRVASVMTSFYQTYFDIGPLPLFNMSPMRVKHPSFHVSRKLLQLIMPKFMDWVIVGQD